MNSLTRLLFAAIMLVACVAPKRVTAQASHASAERGSSRSQCYDCIYDEDLQRTACITVFGGSSNGPGYHTCLATSTGCDMSGPCAPQRTFSTLNVRPDGTIRGRMVVLERKSIRGREFSIGCEGKVLSRQYSASAGRAIRAATSTVELGPSCALREAQRLADRSTAMHVRSHASAKLT